MPPSIDDDPTRRRPDVESSATGAARTARTRLAGPGELEEDRDIFGDAGLGRPDDGRAKPSRMRGDPAAEDGA